MRPKILGIGFHKTGTTTLEVVLKKLGFSVLGPQQQFVAKKNLHNLFSLIEDHDAVQDNPWPIFFRELDESFPKAKFILTIRSNESWLRSIKNHCGHRHSEMREFIYGYGNPIGNERIYLERYKKHNSDVLKYFQDRPEDILIIDWSKEKDWTRICSFLNCKPPNDRLPHANKFKKEGRLNRFFFRWLTEKVRNMR